VCVCVCCKPTGCLYRTVLCYLLEAQKWNVICGGCYVCVCVCPSV